MGQNSFSYASMRKWCKGFFGKAFVYLILFSLNLNVVPIATATDYAHINESPYEDLQQQQTYTNTSALGLTSSDLGVSGPFTFGMGYGSIGQYNLNAQYTQKLSENFALSGLVEYGDEMYRLGATLGFALSDQALAKISAERFSQLLPFSFDSGDVDENVAQNAYGGRYQYALTNDYVKNINFGIYYANTPNILLDPVIFEIGELDAINYRNIAGATSSGFDVGSDIRITPTTEVSAQLYYDEVRYNTEYEEDTSADGKGVGGGLGVKQLLSDRISIAAVGSVRELYDVYTLGVSWLPETLPAAEVALLGQRIVSSNDTPDNNMVGVQLSYNFGMGGSGPRYALSALNTTTDVTEWTNTPAVYMEQVLAITDQYSEFLPVSSEEGEQVMMMSLAAPQITKVAPNAGPLSGNTTVIITGKNFDTTGTTTVQFGTLPAPSVTVDSTTQITAVSPAGSAGVVDIRVTTSAGTSPIVAADHFTYQDVPVVNSISPSVGVPTGNTVVTINGAHLLGASVQFGSTPGTSVTVVNANQITVRSPAGTGTVDVTVTTLSGTSATSDATKFIYEAKPNITKLSPIAGALEGGSVVTITGTNFMGANSVKFGSNAATQFTIDSPTQMTAISPPASVAGPVYVTVTTPVGSNANGSANQFTYEAAPVITSIAPVAGSITGGTSVVLTGNNFTGATSVQFGASPATSFTVNSATKMTAVSPAGNAGVVDIIVTTPSGTSATSAATQFTYEGPPTITQLNPNAGQMSGGNSVVITGTNFTGTSAVKFGTTAASSFTIDSTTQITATSPAHAAGSVYVTVTTPSGTNPNSTANQYTYEDVPVVTSLTPSAGMEAGNTTVIIKGTGLMAATQVMFGTTPAKSFTINSATQITAVSPAGTGMVNITVTTPLGTSAPDAANQYLYEDAPTITGLTPTMGVPGGGTSVIITGTHFANVTAVKFGTTAVTSFTIDSATQMTVISPAHAVGTVNVNVTNPIGTNPNNAANQFTFENAPEVTSLSPPVGALAGDTTVIVKGTGLMGATQVMFGATPAKSFTINSATQITAVSPAGKGSVNVSVTTPLGTSAPTAANQFTYEGKPIITGIVPKAGPLAGDTSLVITGTNFTGTTQVKFGKKQAKSFVVNSPTQITAVSPAAKAGIVNIRVITPLGTTPVAGVAKFTYKTAPAPALTTLAPIAGPLNGGTSVILTGTNFTDATAVKFGTVAATSFTVNSATQITTIAPPGSTGTVDVVVTTPFGNSTAKSYVYQDVPNITALSPNIGLPTGGTSVIITGSNFVGASNVKFGNVAGTNVQVLSATQISVTSPTGVAGSTVDVTVTTTSGTNAITPASKFTYEGPPTVVHISPNTGPLEGQTAVTITGTNFINATAVKFDNTDSVSFTVDSITQITAIVPAGSEGMVNITVTTPIDTSPISANSQFYYQAPPTISYIDPPAGLPSGGTTVVIKGADFLGASEVMFGEVAASNFSIDSATQITATSPEQAAGDVMIYVTTLSGTNTASPIYTYEEPPTVANVAPNAGPLDGQITVTITGANFIDATQVKFGNQDAVNFNVESATQITATTPAGTEGGATITVITPSGSGTSAQELFFYQAPPTVTNITPPAGLPSGGTTVVIKGADFLGASEVMFGEVAAAGFTVDSATQITATSPEQAAGDVMIYVTTLSGTNTSSPIYTYEEPPTVVNVAPNAGPLDGQTIVTITGTNFIDATQVKFGNQDAVNFNVDSATQITATTPVGTEGGATITVITPSGSGTSAQELFFYQAPPTVTNITPPAGLPSGGTTVVISGNDFLGASNVSFGATTTTDFTVDSATQITAKTPENLSVKSTTVNVTVSTLSGTSIPSSGNEFTYQEMPTVTSLSPNVGLTHGGEYVIITGSNFKFASDVKFGEVSATQFTIDSETQMTVISPVHAEGMVNVSVVTPVGTSAPDVNNQFKYNSIDAIVITPNDFSLGEGMMQPMSAIGIEKDTENEKSVNIVWSVENPNIARMLDNGILIGISAGITNITATDLVSGVSETTSVTVLSLPDQAEPDLEPTRAMATAIQAMRRIETPKLYIPFTIALDVPRSLDVGMNAQAYAIARDLDTKHHVTAEVEWKSANPNIIAIDEDGMMIAVSPGEVTIIATLSDMIATKKIIVNEADIHD